MTVVATSRSISAALNARITSSFSALFMRPWIKPTRAFGSASSSSRSSSLAARESTSSDSSISGHTQYACWPDAQCGRDALDELGAALLRQHDGLHGLAARRQLADHGAIEIRVRRHRERPRNRRRGHDELVRHAGGVLAFLLQLQPLLDAEAVLLVDDHECELPERHALLKQRMRADDDARAAVGDCRERGAHAHAPVARRSAPSPRCRAAQASARSSRNAARRATPSAP